MANRFPSMLALLGLAAFAGYANRDKIGAAIKEAQARRGTPGVPRSGLDNVLAGVGDMIDSGREGGGLRGGLGELLDNFRAQGKGEAADSWVRPGPNEGLTPAEVEEAVGAANVMELSKRTGLTRDELLQRLSTAIPETVDRLTPEGKLPETEDEVLGRLTGTP